MTVKSVKPITVFLTLCLIVGMIGSAAAQNSNAASRNDEFFSGLACRYALISGSQHNAGAILRYVQQDQDPLSFFRIKQDRTRGSSIETLTPSGQNFIRNLQRNGWTEWTKLYWSRNDDFVMWYGPKVWWIDGNAMRSSAEVQFSRMLAEHRFSMIEARNDDVIPEHFEGTARHIGSFLSDLMEFDPRSAKISEVGISPGHSALGWTARNDFVRLNTDPKPNEHRLEIFNPKNRSWDAFSPFIFPRNAQLLLVRDTSGGLPEAMVAWHDQNSVGWIGIISRGSSAPAIVATGDAASVLLSPDRAVIYGYNDSLGHFHRIASERHSDRVVFWLSKLETMGHIEQFYLLDDAKYAFVKGTLSGYGPQAAILERKGAQVSVLQSLCQTNASVSRVVSGPRSSLFIPEKLSGHKLVVYLHGGPFAFIGPDGSWLVDLLVASGSPVLAVNYTGSVDRLPDVKPDQDLAETYGTEIERAIGFARESLGSNDRKVVFVADSFGSLVGFSAILTHHAAPDGFFILSGLTEARRIFKDYGPDLDPAFQNYMTRAGRQIGQVMDVARLVDADRSMQLVFVHGERDDRAPLRDVWHFMTEVNGQRPIIPAKISVIEGMEHTPITKKHYETIIDSIQRFLAKF